MQAVVKIVILTFFLSQPVYAGKEIVLSALTLDQATKKVIEQNRSKVLSAVTETVNGKKVHIIKILTSDGRVQYLKVDIDTGKVTK